MVKRVYILGAGASAEAGAPMTSQLVRNLLTTELADLKFHSHNDLTVGRHFWNFLRAFVQNDQWTKNASLDPYNAEDLLNLTYTAELSGLRFPAPVSGLFVDAEWVRRMLGWAILMLLESKIAETLPASYGSFARALHPGDSIITLNYDVTVETSLLNLRGTFDYALPRGACVVDWPGVDVLSGTKVLKLHGSMNWMRCFPSEDGQQACGRVFVRPLTKIYSYGGDTFEICSCGQGSLDALIVPPAHVKAFGGTLLERVWRVAAGELRCAVELFVIGYSLPRAAMSL